MYVYYSVGYAGTFVTFGLATFVFGVAGYPILVAVGAALVILGCLGFVAAARGGIRVEAERLSSQGWFGRQTFDRQTVRAVRIRVVYLGSPQGWVDVAHGTRKLRGITIRHNHGGMRPCKVCAAARNDLATLARDLGVPLIDVDSGRTYAWLRRWGLAPGPDITGERTGPGEGTAHLRPF